MESDDRRIVAAVAHGRRRYRTNGGV